MRLLKPICSYLLFCCAFAHAEPITWSAPKTNNDMNDPYNWNPHTIPQSNDDAIFDSLLNVNTNPTESSESFFVSTFNFPNEASTFTFTFDNRGLYFQGIGITGNNTNTSIAINNVNAVNPVLLQFSSSEGTTGSAQITLANMGSLSGNHSGVVVGGIDENLLCDGSFTIDDGGQITATNEGEDSSIGSGGNRVANVSSSQLYFNDFFTAGNDVSVSVKNTGTFSGNNSSEGVSVSEINGSQFVSVKNFQVGNNFNCIVENIGNDSNIGEGQNNVAFLQAAQMNLETIGSVGNNCSITLKNTGNNTSQTTFNADNIAYLFDQQLVVQNTFQAGNGFNLDVENVGFDSSTGAGNRHQVAEINSNSGTTGNQVLFSEDCFLGNQATITVKNYGSYNGSNTAGGSTVGQMNNDQIGFGSLFGSYNFMAGDNFTLKVSNEGNDSAVGIGSDVVGNVTANQVRMYSPCSLGENAEITLTNKGTYTGQGSEFYILSGSIGGNQLTCLSTFSARDNFKLTVKNFGMNSSSGRGSAYVGTLTNGGQQASFLQGITVEDNATFKICNKAESTGSTSNLNQTGCLIGYGKQMFVNNQFQTGDHLSIEISNDGTDGTSGSSGSYTAVIFNDSADNSAAQLHLGNGGMVGHNASISLTNSGTFTGSNAGTCLVGFITGQQFHSPGYFVALDNFNISASNSGTQTTSGLSYNNIGQVNSNAQIQFGDTCVVKNNATFTVQNNGKNNDTTSTNNYIGFVNGNQLQFDGEFFAGTNLNISVNNTASNKGDSSNTVGYIGGSQIYFGQSCNLNDGSTISAMNTGTVSGSQIVFTNGFNISSGQVTIEALNSGIINDIGILIQGDTDGGNALINLSSSSLFIEVSPDTFTIAGLNGDESSIVQSQPTLIINTDSTTKANFQGAIQNFTLGISSLVKTGHGKQTLSGTNIYTGLTTVQEGTLSLTGSIAKDLLINPQGILSGTGTIHGTLTNTGTISPGNSIGTLNVITDYNNNGGTYIAEVDGNGHSDLILVTGAANLNGGTVVASPLDNTVLINRRYIIVTAGSINGTYTDVTSSTYLTPVLTYDRYHVYLTFQSNLTQAAETCNQLAVASQLDSIINPTPFQSSIIASVALLMQNQAQQALESLSGYQHTDDIWVSDIATRQFIRRLYDPLRSIVTAKPCCNPCPERCWTTWLETGGGTTKLKSNKEAHGFNMNSYELTGGLQNTLCNDITLGIAGSYEHDFINYKHGGSGKRNVGYGGLYGLYRPHEFYALADITYGYSDNHLKRSVNAAPLHESVRSKPNISQVAFYGEIGCDFAFDCFLMQPFAGIQAGRSWRNHVTEENDTGLGLKVKNHQWSATTARIGVHLTLSNHQSFDASIDVAWNKWLSKRRNTADGRFIDFGDNFEINGIPFDDNGVDYALTLSNRFNECVRGYLEFSGETWSHASTYDVLAGLECRW